jgi:hypothetical protein
MLSTTFLRVKVSLVLNRANTSSGDHRSMHGPIRTMRHLPLLDPTLDATHLILYASMQHSPSTRRRSRHCLDLVPPLIFQHMFLLHSSDVLIPMHVDHICSHVDHALSFALQLPQLFSPRLRSPFHFSYTTHVSRITVESNACLLGFGTLRRDLSHQDTSVSFCNSARACQPKL